MVTSQKIRPLIVEVYGSILRHVDSYKVERRPQADSFEPRVLGWLNGKLEYDSKGMLYGKR